MLAVGRDRVHLLLVLDLQDVLDPAQPVELRAFLPDGYAVALQFSQSFDVMALVDRARAAKEALGERLFVLGHHYQRDEVIQFADVTGDSFKLARDAAARPFLLDVHAILRPTAESVLVVKTDQPAYPAGTQEPEGERRAILLPSPE